MFDKKFTNKIKLDYGWTNGPACRQSGMTYVELIVVMSIFALMSSIVMFNYNSFQKKVDVKTLSSDVALKIVEAQKYSVAGKLPSAVKQIDISTNFSSLGGINAWRPSYGVFFDLTTSPKSFIYFVDIDNPQNGLYEASGEFLEKVSFNKNNKIDSLQFFCGSTPTSITNLTISFKRPDSGAMMSSSGTQLACSGTNYVNIRVSSSSDTFSYINVYQSGRIEIK